MKKIKRLISLLLCLLIVISNLAYADTTESVTFSDIAGNKYETILNKWVEKGFIKGYPDGTIKPYDKIVRSEIAALINRVFNYKEIDKIKYYDVFVNDWYYDDVCIAHKAGYMIGDDLNNFNPRNNITRQELSAIAVRLGKMDKFVDEEVLKNFEDYSLIPEWSKEVISSAVKAGLFKDFINEKFNPTEQVSRLEVIVVLDRLMKFIEDGGLVDILSDMEGLNVDIEGFDKVTNTTFKDSARQYTRYNLPKTITFNLPDGQKIKREIVGRKKQLILKNPEHKL